MDNQPQELLPAPSGKSPDDLRPTGLAPGEQPVAEGEVTPEQQEVYNQLVYQFAKYVEGSGADQVLQYLNNPDNPVYVNIAKAQYNIGEQIINSAAQAGANIEGDEIFHAGAEQTEILMDMAADAGILPFEKDSEEYQEQLKLAFTESRKMMGEDMLNGQDGEQHMMEAEDMAAVHISNEAQAGQVPDGFEKSMQGIGMNPNLNTTSKLEKKQRPANMQAAIEQAVKSG